MIRSLYFAVYFLSTCFVYADRFKREISVEYQQPKQKISFMENKGQVCDQFYRSRPDVLFSGTDGKMVYHIRNNGVSYQLNRVDSWKSAGSSVFEGVKKGPTKVPDKITIYRIDINWLNATKKNSVQTGETFPGSDNYYFEHCAGGALDVKSYRSVKVKDLYPNIDLHYYEHQGHLKYDYIVAANADYTQIQMEIKGAEIRLNDDGSLSMVTPLGEIVEEAPVVFQEGKKLNARYVVRKKILSFEVEGYDPTKTLIIDPVTRAWGSYYGGLGEEYPYFLTTNANGDVYMTGETNSNNGTCMATVGSHQDIIGGGVKDAFLVKFNAAGVRQWATYYGGTDAEAGLCCVLDNTGNIYVTGSTASAGGSVIATLGSFQPTIGGLDDAFLVKFNSSGIRQWATYYGGTGYDGASAVAIDPFGNIFIAGTATSTTGISTSGTHQPILNAGSDAFIAKFTPSGTRIWGTYYGGNGSDAITCMAIDISGNIFVSGQTSTPIAGTLIATPGSHQPTWGGGSFDSFLTKFNASGQRIWGTYYGGTGTEFGYGCSVDGYGNIFIGGRTDTNSGTSIATLGSHQPNPGLGIDGYVAKFNSAGVRQWGTYYGGNALEVVYSLSTNGAGDVYIAGEAQSTGAGIISTPGSYKQVMTGGNDAFIAKFDASGARLWGTYYGANSSDFAYACTADMVGNVYLAGYTSPSGGTGIGSIGSHQPTFGGGSIDCFLAKLSTCSVTLGPSISANNPLCSNATLSFTGTVSNTLVTNYVWSGPNSFTSSVLSPSINNILPVNAGTYTLTVSDGSLCQQSAIINVTVDLGPTITVNSGSVCSGNSFTMIPSGGISYTFQGGNAVVTPTASASYTVTGTNTIGCNSQSQATCYITVEPSPTITVNSGTICSGNSFTIVPSGASTYSFQGGSAIVSPTTNSNYTIAGTSTAGCVSASYAVSSITVLTLPLPSITVNSGSICSGNSFTLIPSGASTYTIQGGILVVSPTVNSSYTVVGTSSLGCISSSFAISNVTVIIPPISAVSNMSILCAGFSATLSASGANTYSWSSGGNTANEIISPTITTIYTVTGTDGNGCQAFAVVTQSVIDCTGIYENEFSETSISLYPNPFTNKITLVVGEAKQNLIQVYNSLGMLIYTSVIKEKTEINLTQQPSGIYFVRIGTEIKKIIKE